MLESGSVLAHSANERHRNRHSASPYPSKGFSLTVHSFLSIYYYSIIIILESRHRCG
jgi:hypothetical protein